PTCTISACIKFLTILIIFIISLRDAAGPARGSAGKGAPARLLPGNRLPYDDPCLQAIQAVCAPPYGGLCEHAPGVLKRGRRDPAACLQGGFCKAQEHGPGQGGTSPLRQYTLVERLERETVEDLTRRCRGG